MTTRLTCEQRYDAVCAIASYRTELALLEGITPRYYAAQTELLKYLSNADLFAALEEAGITPEDL
ncbi:MAG: hypothetical protein KA204_00225 [Chromatiaceae bacterium]|nr:hypothetical protein [Chromatiaceae bacterium]